MTTITIRPLGRHERVTKPGVVPFFTEDRTDTRHNGHAVRQSATCPACSPTTYPRHAKHRADRTAA